MFGPMGLSNSVLKSSNKIASFQTGYLYHITLITLIGSSLLLGVRQFWLLFGYFFDFRIIIIIILVFFTKFKYK